MKLAELQELVGQHGKAKTLVQVERDEAMAAIRQLQERNSALMARNLELKQQLLHMRRQRLELVAWIINTDTFLKWIIGRVSSTWTGDVSMALAFLADQREEG